MEVPSQRKTSNTAKKMHNVLYQNNLEEEEFSLSFNKLRDKDEANLGFF
jgi:hypothetical protein